MKIRTILAGAVLAIVGASANAASVSLVYTGTADIDSDGRILVGLGDTITLDLVIDFSDQPTLGGGFDIHWDPTVFALEDYTGAGLGDPAFGRDPVVETGRLYNGAVGNFNGLTTGLIGSMAFTLIGLGPGGPSFITPSGTAGDSGPWIDGTDFVSVITPDYVGISVFIPVPAAVWFMLSGLGVLFGVARRKAS